MTPAHGLNVTAQDALAALEALADHERGRAMAAYHKVDRVYLGVPVPQIDTLARRWRQDLPLEARLSLADALWAMGGHETMVAAAKLLEQARIRPDDDGAWRLITQWAPGFDGWAVSDHAGIAGQKRLVANPARVGDLESWRSHPNMWTRRATLVMTLPWAKLTHPKPADLAIRAQVLGWAAAFVPDRAWFIQKAIAWWLRDLSKRDPITTREFLAEHGSHMKAFARKEAARYL